MKEIMNVHSDPDNPLNMIDIANKVYGELYRRTTEGQLKNWLDFEKIYCNLACTKARDSKVVKLSTGSQEGEQTIGLPLGTPILCSHEGIQRKLVARTTDKSVL